MIAFAFLPLLADAIGSPPTASVTTPWWVTLVSTVGASAGTYLVNQLMRLRSDKRKETVEDRTAERQEKKEDVNQVISDQREFIERQAKVIEEDRKTYQDELRNMHAEVASLRKKLEATITRQQAAEKLAIKYQMRISHLEEMLEGRNIPFKRLKEDDSANLLIPPPPPPPLPTDEGF